MAELALAFALGAIAWWALTRLLRAAAYGGSKVGSNARQRWLAKMDYEALLRTRKQIDDEIGRRQP
jgi:hypothetical protein